MNTKRIASLAGIALAIAACGNQGSYPQQQQVYVPSQGQVVQQPPQQVTGAQSVMDAQQFNLGTVVALLKGNQIANAQALQDTVNTPSSGINNVDLDQDGQVDYVAVQETAANGNASKHFEFVAYPSSKNGQDAMTIATVDLQDAGGQVVVQAGYPSYVSGYDQYYYHDTFARNLLFFTWAMQMNRGYYMPGSYYSFGYHPRAVLGAPLLQRTRTTYQTTTHVSPVAVTRTPSTYDTTPRATKVPSAFTQRAVPASNNLSDRAGTVRSFQAQDVSQPRPRATGFGASQATQPAAAPAYVHPASAPGFGQRTGFGSASPQPAFHAPAASQPAFHAPPAAAPAFRAPPAAKPSFSAPRMSAPAFRRR